MTCDSINIKNAFSTNRAEELGLDVWDEFVIPLFYKELDLKTARKARRIIGGRGCGKTMLLRYFSYHSQFSHTRESFDDDTIKNIGLYWRADTNFLPMLTKQGIEKDEWIRVFKYYLTLIISLEVLKSLRIISSSNCDILDQSKLDKLNFDELEDYDINLNGNYEKIYTKLRKKLRECESAVHNPPTLKQLHKLPDTFLTEGLIPLIQNQIHGLSDSTFSIFIDEYENMLEYQQEAVNTNIKHGQAPLIYHIAMKRNGMNTNKTLHQESIQGISDYRNIDLDNFLIDSDIELFSAEILLHRLSKTKYRQEEYDSNIIKNISRISERLKSDYKKKTIALAKAILPSKSYKELADEALKDKSILNKLKKDLSQAFKDKGYNGNIRLEDLISHSNPQATIIIPSLISRDNNKIESIFIELEKSHNGQSSKLSANSDWIANNFIGCYLRVFRASSKPCPIYSGFSTFVKLSRGNIRHFLELCNATVIRLDSTDDSLAIPVEVQAQAAKYASEEILDETSSYGTLGTKIRTFIYNLGSILEYSQLRIKQSEPEVNHFSIKHGFSDLTNEDHKFLNEAEKWGVLYKEKSTKVKNIQNPDSIEWILNPIYAPYFMISYRKKRKLEISSEQFKQLHSGSIETQKSIERSYMSKWDLDNTEKPLSYSLL